MERLEEIIKDQLEKARLIHPRVAMTDTTAMEKAIACLTDTDLLYKARVGVEIPSGVRPFRRRAKKVLLCAKKLGRDKLERIEKANGEQSHMACEVMGKVRTICELIPPQIHHLSKSQRKQAKRHRESFSELKELTQRIIDPNAQRFCGHHIARKVLSLDETHTVAIKQGKSTEHGSKVSLTVDRNGFVVTHRHYCKSLADINTLPDVVEGWQRTFGKVPKELGTDREFHHPKKSRRSLPTQQIARQDIPYKRKKKHPDPDSYWFSGLETAHACIAALTRQLKTDHRIGRFSYRGFEGDQIDVNLITLAWNSKKWIHMDAQRLR